MSKGALALLAGALLLIFGSGIARGESPTAGALPATVPLGDLVWLHEGPVAPGEVVTVTLTSPTGQSCVAADAFGAAIRADADGQAELWARPADCAPELGQWTATFDSGAAVPFAVGPSTLN